MLQILLAIGGGRMTKDRINRGASEAIMGAARFHQPIIAFRP